MRTGSQIGPAVRVARLRHPAEQALLSFTGEGLPRNRRRRCGCALCIDRGSGGVPSSRWSPTMSPSRPAAPADGLSATRWRRT